MTFSSSQRILFRRILGGGLIAMGITGVVSLFMKEIPLALNGERSTGIVTKVEKITTSYGSTGNSRGGVRAGGKYASDLMFMYIDFTTKDGQAMQVKTLATFNTEAKEGDLHPMIYLPSKPETAKIYSAKQLWLPMSVGIVISTLCLVGGRAMVKCRSLPLDKSRT